MEDRIVSSGTLPNTRFGSIQSIDSAIQRSTTHGHAGSDRPTHTDWSHFNHFFFKVPLTLFFPILTWGFMSHILDSSTPPSLRVAVMALDGDRVW